MPTTNEGLDQVEAVVSSDNSTNNAASSAGSVSADPAPRRRRGGRRVVRGVGAAGASLELKVEEHAKAPLFEEPKLEPAQPARDSADFNDADDDEPIDDEAAAIILDQWLNKVPGDKNENH